jgi:hypothetical protein
LTHQSNFNKRPAVTISQSDGDCALGWREITDRLRERGGARRIAIECYPGVLLDPLSSELVSALGDAVLLECAEAMLTPSAIEEKFASVHGDDPVFGQMSPITLDDFFDPEKIDRARRAAASATGRVVAIGTGATLLLPSWDLLIYVDVSRWEIQRRQRNGEISNLGLKNAGASAAQLYKRAFFLDWRAADRMRHELYEKVDFWIDGNLPDQPAVLNGKTLQSALFQVTRQPFSLVPFFDPGPWGGQWMRRNFDLPDGPPNYAWCFNCVPEENSLVLCFGTRSFE